MARGRERMAGMVKRRLLWLVLLSWWMQAARAGDLTVKVLDQTTGKPVSDALIRLHYDCWHSVRPTELKQRTDASGVAVFHSLSIGPREFCIFPDYAFAAMEQQFAFTSLQAAASLIGQKEHVLTSLPSEVTFHVRRLSLSERIRNLFRYD